MNNQKTNEEIAEQYIKRLVEQKKNQYADACNAGKKNMYVTLAEKDSKILYLQEMVRNFKSKTQEKTFPSIQNSNVTYNQDWTWLSKIIYALQTKDAPLRSQQMIEFFVPIDVRMNTSHDKVGYFSAFLSKALKNERVVKIKVKGFKGYFYALPEWMIDGELPATYYRKMNLFVNQ
jgi:arginine repressor